MDSYQLFIQKSRYARYLPDKKRREHWNETVARYFDFMEDHLKFNCKFTLDQDLRTELEKAVNDLDVMPSMRCIMTAGKALERDNTAGYNCSFVSIDDPKSFDEAMLILMNGCGVGFSVERQFVNQLPEIPDVLEDSDTVVAIRDSKEGWAKALRMLLALLYSGEVPKWDMSKVRPAGARLKIFGGRSSGPGPLDDLFRFIVVIFKGAAGRKLTSIECHDVMCKIGEVIVSGGVRRSALISLSNLSDDRMRHAKSGEWWKQYGHRSLSNNSAVYNERPDVGIFLTEWLSLYESKSGERGMFNREASIAQVKKNERRDPDHMFGTNPCCEIILRPNGFCNLSEVVIRSTDTLSALKNKIRIAAIFGTFQSSLTHFPYLRKVWKKNAMEERLLGVSLTGIYDNPYLNDYKSERLPGILETLKKVAIDTNKEYAEKLGIEQSAAITCVKPSGTVSNLVNSASGIHPRHSPFYIRRVRNDIKDPLTDFLIKAGVPVEEDVMNSSVAVFSFPQKAPKKALYKADVDAISHLNLWLIYQRHWCEHKPSVTISVKENEWPTVGAWVWEHFDELSGVAFLPFDQGIYRQPPYETVTKEEYDALVKKMPKKLNWDDLIEEEDVTEGVQTLACTAGCEV